MPEQSKIETTSTNVIILVKFKPIFFFYLNNHTCSFPRAELESKGWNLLLLKVNFERLKNACNWA